MEVLTQVLCLAMNVYFEARSEDTKGQLAVAEVTLNRVKARNTQTISVMSCGNVSSLVGRMTARATTQSIRSMGESAANGVVRSYTDNKIVGDDVTHYHTTYNQPYWTSSYERVESWNTYFLQEEGLKNMLARDKVRIMNALNNTEAFGKRNWIAIVLKYDEGGKLAP